jgi:hypothetical protein
MKLPALLPGGSHAGLGCGSVGSRRRPQRHRAIVLDAIARIESHGNPNAVGDGGRALGVYQIHCVYWKDGTQLLGVDWPHRDAADPNKARRVVKAYLLHYGRGKSLLEMARIHNGGPRGDKKKATLPYARKLLADGSLSAGLYTLPSSPLFTH